MRFKIKIIFTLLLFFCITTYPAFPQDTASARFFPLKTGNSWTYSYLRYIIFPTLFETGKLRRDMSKDTIINNQKYFYHPWWLGINWLRYDSANGNLLFSNSSGGCSIYSGDKILDSLASSLGNINYCQHNVIFTRQCVSINNENVFGFQKQVKEFKHDGLTLSYLKYAQDFGIVYYCTGEPPPCTYYEWLQGCVINGVVYGDTSLTSVQTASNTIPEKIYLSQNYPNPFNPITKINYELRVTSDVELKVFDVLGKEVAVLVNERMDPGSYSVEFDARLSTRQGSNLPSGIYFYTLRAGEFIETKRMILLK